MNQPDLRERHRLEWRNFFSNSTLLAEAVRGGNRKEIAACRADLEGMALNTDQPGLRSRCLVALLGEKAVEFQLPHVEDAAIVTQM